MQQGLPVNEQDSNSYLELQSITKKFGFFTALKDISFSVNEGEFVCFLGPSGCGKTTLLRAIAGLDIQTSGSIRQGSQDISILPPSERDFGIVFQSYALFPNLTIAKNIAFGLENAKRRKTEIKNRVIELLELIGLQDQSNKYPAQLSGGQQQRVSLARAIATSPGLLLLDEPLSALDAQVRTYLRKEIKQLQRKLGITTIMVTHDQEEALTMADRIVVMNHGVIEQLGSPEEIYGKPQTEFVAGFIGTMNFMQGTVVEAGLVETGASKLKCDTNGFANGDLIKVSIRPEDILPLSAEQHEADNAQIVSILETEFLGSFLRVTLRAAGESAPEMLADLSINAIRRMDIKSGDQLRITLPADRLNIYSNTQGASH